MSKTYSEKLKDPRWQKKRLEILSRDRWRCAICGDSESTLHVHHYWYQKGKEPWEYPDTALKALCWECHEDEELFLLRIRKLISQIHPDALKGLASAAETLVHDHTYSGTFENILESCVEKHGGVL